MNFGEKLFKLRKEPLLFDYEFLSELSSEYIKIRKKCELVAIPCTFLFVVNMVLLAITAKRHIGWTQSLSLIFLGFAVGIFGFIYSIGTMCTYELLVKNDQYCDRFLFKLKKKIRSKIENW